MRESTPAIGGLIFTAGFVVLFAYFLGDGGQLMEMVRALFERASDMLGSALLAVVHFIATLPGAQ